MNQRLFTKYDQPAYQCDDVPGHVGTFIHGPDLVPCPTCTGDVTPEPLSVDRIVGSGFARMNTVCQCGCGLDIPKGWEAWVTAWNDADDYAFLPSHLTGDQIDSIVERINR